MPMRPEYIEAIETRLRWTKNLERENVQRSWVQYGNNKGGKENYGARLRLSYYRGLTHGPLFVMSPQFCGLVEHATASMPDDVAFDPRWLQTQAGWLYLAVPFIVPEVEEGRKLLHAPDGTRYPMPRLQIRAVSWARIDTGPKAGDWQLQFYGDNGWARALNPAPPKIPLYDFDGDEFFPLSHMSIHDGDLVGPRITEFEASSDSIDSFHSDGPNGAIYPGRYVGDELWRHELRWAFAAFHLMSQKLTVQTTVATDRPTRRRAERTKQVAPPFIQVITLRRLEADRKRDPQGNEVDWQWQWSVEGHWRWQFYSTEGVHKRIFIESYTKGPADKPFKNTIKLFAAKR
jgi:hypothetical protein